MNPKTIKQLINLNRDFYDNNAKSFSQTRQSYWPGWFKLLEVFKKRNFKPSSVLDVGCGNGRFGEFIQEHFPSADYTGVDFSKDLLSRTTLSDKYKFLEMDITDLESLKFKQTYDLIVLMAVMHHIPSFELRKNILEKLSGHLKQGGLMIITFWDFKSDEKLFAKHIPVNETKLDITLEENDYLFDWNGDKSSLRYCHYANLAEQDKLLSSFEIKHSYYADGRNAKLNRYFVLEKPSN